MSKVVDTVYVLPNPLQSYVPGENEVTAESDAGDVPHGLNELGRAIRHIAGHGAACDIVAQPWLEDDAPISISSPGYTSLCDFIAPADEMFGELEVIIYYEAIEEIDDCFKVWLLDSAEVITLDAVDAGGDLRVVKAAWPDSKIELEAPGVVTFNLSAKGNGAIGNPVRGWYVRRVALTDIPDGVFYEGEFVPPDSVQFDEDEFLCVSEDILKDLAEGPQALHLFRRRLYAGWGKTDTIADGSFAMLGRYPGRFLSFHGVSSSNQDGAVHGGNAINELDFRTEVALVADTLVTEPVRMNPEPFISELGMFYLSFDNPNALVCWSIEGP